jgi:hypothetical protein
MAKWNSGTQTIGLETSVIQYDTTDFNVSLQGFDIPCSSNLHSGLTCIFQVGAVTSLS